MQELMDHLKVHYRPTQSLEGKTFQCPTLGCTETFPSMQDLMAHMKVHYKPNRYFNRGGGRSPSFSGVVWRGDAAQVGLEMGGVTGCAPPPLNEPPSRVPLVPKGRSSRRRSCSSCLGARDAPPPPVTPVPMPGWKLPPFAMERREATGKGRSGLGRGHSLAPCSHIWGSSPLGQGPLCMWGSEPAGGGSCPRSTNRSVPHGTRGRLPCTLRCRFAWLPLPGWGGCSRAQHPPPHPRLCAGLPSSPVLAGHASNSRIVWEHTRGRYTCTQCPYSTASREEMTLHIEDHRKNPPPPPGRMDAEMDFGMGLASFHAKLTPEMENSLYSQL
ncbi:ZN414 protein, partial [Corythaeola cristata]|nr:ZN414 protein [Corythaeola cristata]